MLRRFVTSFIKSLAPLWGRFVYVRCDSLPWILVWMARACSQLRQPDESASEMNERHE